MLPNFLIIGAARSGTDFLFYSLANHPSMCIASKREIHFFDRNYDKGYLWYEQHFQHCTPGNLVGEKTANYIMDPKCPERIKETLKNVKLLCVLRNPIERAYSHYRNWVGLGFLKSKTSFRECMKLYPEILIMGNYYAHLKNYLTFFPMKDLLVIFSDNLFNSPYREYKRVFSFLGINENQNLPLIKKYNESKKLYHIRGYFFSQNKIKKIQRIFPTILERKILNLLEYRFEPITQEDRSFLKEYYYNMNEKLFDLLNTRKDWND
ncbi:MAG: sulfotransferase domain-containing protein [Candidatus Hermodarchaeota archaeon]